MSIAYEVNRKISGEQLAAVFSASGIRRPVQDLGRMTRMLEHADILVTAWAGDRLVGVARTITDYAYCAYLSDLAVDKEFQKQGIGKELVKVTRQTLGDEAMLLLLSAPEAMEYYPKLGFDKLNNAFQINRVR